MILIKNKIVVFFFGVMASFIICKSSYADKNNMVLRDVVVSEKKEINSRYIPLDSKYRYVNYGGIESPEMLIDTKSGIEISPNNFELCSVQDVIFHPENLLIYQVSFKINDKLSDVMQKFFKPRIGETIAIILENDTVFTVVDIREPLITEFTVTIFGRTKSQIANELKKVCYKTNVE